MSNSKMLAITDIEEEEKGSETLNIKVKPPHMPIVDVMVFSSQKIVSLSKNCRVVTVLPPKYTIFTFNGKTVPENKTFAEAEIKDGDTIAFDMEIFISD